MTSRQQELAGLCGKYSLKIMYAFGSRSKECASWLMEEKDSFESSISDLDIGVLPGSLFLTARHKVEFTVQLEDMFEIGRVDLVVLPEAPPFLASRIIQGERLYAEDEDLADEYDLYILRRAGDLMPFHRQRLEMIFGESE